MLLPFKKTAIDEAWDQEGEWLYQTCAGGVQRYHSLHWKSVRSHILSAGAAGCSGSYEKLDQRNRDRGGDLSEMVYVLLKSELESFDRVRSLALKLSGDREKQKKEMEQMQSR